MTMLASDHRGSLPSRYGGTYASGGGTQVTYTVSLEPNGNPWLLATMVATVVVCVRWKVSPLWLIAAGGLVGGLLT